jgi:hypothetical protein
MAENLLGRGETRRPSAARPFIPVRILGEAVMRSNSGNDQSRNNMRDPTMRDRSMGRDESPTRSKTKAPADHRQGRKD